MTSKSPRAAKGKTAGWQDQVYDLLRKHNVTQFAYVPDAGHKILIDRRWPTRRPLRRLDHRGGGVALLAAPISRARGVLLMQSTARQLREHAVADSGGRFRSCPDQHARRLGEGKPCSIPWQGTQPVLEAMTSPACAPRAPTTWWPP